MDDMGSRPMDERRWHVSSPERLPHVFASSRIARGVPGVVSPRLRKEKRGKLMLHLALAALTSGATCGAGLCDVAAAVSSRVRETINLVWKPAMAVFGRTADCASPPVCDTYCSKRGGAFQRECD